MKITLNNREIVVEQGTTLLQLITTEGLPTTNVAIAVNNRLVLNAQWQSTLLQENDRIVAIAAAYGG